MKNSHQSILGLVLALVLYVLSIGPVAAYYQATNVDHAHPAVIGFYRPLFWCNAKVPPFGALMVWYVDFWIRLAGGAP